MTLEALNHLPQGELKTVLFKCCGSHNWVNKMLGVFPVEDMIDLFEDAEEKWYQCSEGDWLEAFAQHPKIGDVESLTKKFASTADWASSEQAEVSHASQQVIEALAYGNKLYEERFGYIFIVCATGKTAPEMLDFLNARLLNAAGDEMKIAADEQMKITQIRLEKLLA